MINPRITDQELAKMLKEKAVGFNLSAGEKQSMKYTLMEKIAISDVTKTTESGYKQWKYQLNLKGVTMPFLPILFAILLAGGFGTASLANSASPGDPLYGLDQWLERAQTRSARSDTTRANLIARFSEERLAELAELRSTDPSQLTEKAQELWEEHHQEALDRLAESIERVAALQEKFQEKLAEADSDAEKAAFQKVLDHLADVKERREERLAQLEGRTFPGVGPLLLRNELKEWKEISKEEREQIREQIKEEFEDHRGWMGIGRSWMKLDDSTTTSSSSSDSSNDDDRDKDEDEDEDRSEEDDSDSSSSSVGSTGVTAQALEARIPYDENGNIDLSLIDTDHDGVPDKDDKNPDWPLHTM